MSVHWPECVWFQPWWLADSRRVQCAPADGSFSGARASRRLWEGSYPVPPPWGALGRRYCCSRLWCHHLWSTHSVTGTVRRITRWVKDGSICIWELVLKTKGDVNIYQCLKARAMDRELNQCVICHLWTRNISEILSYPNSRTIT